MEIFNALCRTQMPGPSNKFVIFLETQFTKQSQKELSDKREICFKKKTIFKVTTSPKRQKSDW